MKDKSNTCYLEGWLFGRKGGRWEGFFKIILYLWVNSKILSLVAKKYSSKLDIISLVYSYLCACKSIRNYYYGKIQRIRLRHPERQSHHTRVEDGDWGLCCLWLLQPHRSAHPKGLQCAWICLQGLPQRPDYPLLTPSETYLPHYQTPLKFAPEWGIFLLGKFGGIRVFFVIFVETNH